MKIVMIGKPGCGKGTQSKLLSGRYGIPHISTGDILRDIAKQESDLGLEVKELLESGEFVSDEMIDKVVVSRLKEPDCANGYILDGYPRTVNQLASFMDVFGEDNIKFIHLDVPERIISERIKSRNDNRAEDNEETLKIRMQIYWERTHPIIDSLKNGGSDIMEVDGDAEKDEVFEKMCYL